MSERKGQYLQTRICGNAVPLSSGRWGWVCQLLVAPMSGPPVEGERIRFIGTDDVDDVLSVKSEVTYETRDEALAALKECVQEIQRTVIEKSGGGKSVIGKFNLGKANI